MHQLRQNQIPILTAQTECQLRQQQPERRIRWRLVEIRSQKVVQGLEMAFGELLHPHQRALAAEDGQDRHQQHPPLREADPTAHAAVGQRLEETDQIGCSSWILERCSQR